MRKAIYKSVSAIAGAFLLLFVLFAFPVPVQAASRVESIDITVELEEDGSAWFTEVWDINIPPDGTENYLAKQDLDNQVISQFSVTDKNGKVYEDAGDWDSDLSKSQKADKSGLIKTNGGYELCWGIGNAGSRNTFTLKYKMTNLVKGYNGGALLTQKLVSEDLSDPQKVHVIIRYPGVSLTKDNTGIWAFGFDGDIELIDGGIVVQNTQALSGSNYVSVMAEFNPGMFSPADVRSTNLEDVREEALKGSSFTKSFGDIWNGFFRGFRSGGWIFFLGAFFGFLSVVGKKRNRAINRLGGMKPEYKNPDYSRELPFGGNLSATYARLKLLGKLSNDGVIVGSFLLKWVRSKQIEIVLPPGANPNSDKRDIKLYAARPDMEASESELYGMLLGAAGPDYVLQPKEFEKWSKKNYSRVEGWMERYKNIGMQEMRSMGAMAEEDAKMLGFIPYKKTVMTPAGEDLTIKMFGFKKYLEDFTIINEREAREVQLWDEYLVFAQLFGIADKVAEQFEALYPKYFQDMQTASGGYMSSYDMYVLLRVSNMYSRAMWSGYRAGYTAAHSSSYSGGGGSASSSGGGSFGGGGGGGTR